jgi:hypothetical protein
MDKQKKACINVKIRGNQHFLWPVLLAIHFLESYPERVTKCQQYKKLNNLENINFPLKVHGISKFESQGKINIAIFGYKMKKRN